MGGILASDDILRDAGVKTTDLDFYNDSPVLIDGRSRQFLVGYYVDATNGNDDFDGRSPNTPWQTVDPKVNGETFDPGEIILLNRGKTWSGTITIPSGGALRKLITLGAYGSGAKPIMNGGAATAITATAANRGYWRIKDLDIRCTGDVLEGSRGIYHNRWDAGVPLTVPGWIVEDCEFNCGIFINGPDAIIRNNTFDGSGNAEARSFIICRGAVSSRALIRGNTIHDGLERGIWPGELADDVIVEENTIYDIAANGGVEGRGIDIDGYDGPCSGAVVRNNRIYNTDDKGIQMENCIGNPRVYGNEISGVTSHGIVFANYDAHGAIADMRGVDAGGIAYNNLIYEITQAAVRFVCGAGWDLYHNTMADCQFGVDFAWGTAGFQDGIQLFDNIISHHSSYAIRFLAAMTELEDHDYNVYYDPGDIAFGVLDPWSANTYAQFRTATGKEVDSVNDSPDFVNAGADNYHLLVTSPAVGEGVDVGVTDDLDGVMRGGPPDIGAYEYVA